MSSTFTVYFDGQFWVGVLEISCDGEVRAARHVFGPEPSGPELYEFGLHGFADLLDVAAAAPPVAAGSAQRRPNPKRVARAVARARAEPAVSTAAQEAMRLAIEAGATARRTRSREERDRDDEERRQRKRARARDRHRGRA